jgi:hypothetical protein
LVVCTAGLDVVAEKRGFLHLPEIKPLIEKIITFPRLSLRKENFCVPFFYNAQFLKEGGTDTDGHSAIADIFNNYKLLILFKMHYTINYKMLLYILPNELHRSSNKNSL